MAWRLLHPAVHHTATSHRGDTHGCHCQGTGQGAHHSARQGRQKGPAMNAPIRWPAEAVWEAVSPLLPGFTVEVLPTIDSTNTELMRRARAGLAEPVLLVEANN